VVGDMAIIRWVCDQPLLFAIHKRYRTYDRYKFKHKFMTYMQLSYGIS